ncbi:Rieske domain-containing protein [Fusarium keratoplasticum]|uniref:Rieske domain-containing protein n=1 Tax=Fusarium keratoplasticum TaxID=1328300 RepID=A0ACC0QI69_9HYPO|nr:Rieske domain-containing protein [Fusarium keratoplasticum]KAI8654508.1 Rieske domain-containing protein [Fusarium keratoplasticum]
MLSFGSAFLFVLAAIVVVAARRIFSKPQVAHSHPPPQLSSTKISSQPLPATWYGSEKIHELERRAIFSKKWILLTHKIRLPESGAYIRYEEAGFNFFLIRNNEGMVRGFHNICRHRAFPVVTKDNGTASILSCKYHGWSYGFNGQLAKAPEYQNLKGFDKKKNGLFPLHVHVDERGFVWVNMDAKLKPEVSWASDFSGVDRLARHESFNLDDYKFDHTSQEDIDYNWKTLADKYSSNSKIEQLFTTGEESEKSSRMISDFYFPNAAMTFSPHFFIMMRCNPTGPARSSVEYEVFRHQDASDEDFNQVHDIIKRASEENKSLPNPSEKNFNTGILVNEAPLYFQSQVRQLLEHHSGLEEVAKKEIRPAQQILDQTSEQDESLFSSCSGLSCGKLAKELAW